MSLTQTLCESHTDLASLQEFANLVGKEGVINTLKRKRVDSMNEFELALLQCIKEDHSAINLYSEYSGGRSVVIDIVIDLDFDAEKCLDTMFIRSTENGRNVRSIRNRGAVMKIITAYAGGKYDVLGAIKQRLKNKCFPTVYECVAGFVQVR